MKAQSVPRIRQKMGLQVFLINLTYNSIVSLSHGMADLRTNCPCFPCRFILFCTRRTIAYEKHFNQMADYRWNDAISL